jgi:SagB-type dehydrogenase family enzyme
MTADPLLPLDSGPGALGSRAPAPGEGLAALYHENTKVHPFLLEQLEAAPGLTPGELRRTARAHKSYSLHPQLALPAVGAPRADVPFDAVVAARRSARSFSGDGLTREEISRLLLQTYGRTGELRLPGGHVLPLRAAPSAGALYPGELYLAIRPGSGVPAGVYHYEVPAHALARLEEGDPEPRLRELLVQRDLLQSVAVVVLIAAVFPRTSWKYGERGYRYALLDIGHLAQNLLLSCTAMGLAATTTGGFCDDGANALLDLDGVEESVVYVALLGRED